MKSNHLCRNHARAKTPAASRGGDPVFAGIHGFLAGLRRENLASPAMTRGNGST